MVNIRSIIVKLSGHCNLNCKYCYLYQHQDRTFLDRPKFMADEVFDQMLYRIEEYSTGRPHPISLTFHGGEPTLIGSSRFRSLAKRARGVLGSYLGQMSIQTNATLIDSDWIKAFQDEGITVGVSLDGPEISNAYRVDHAGHSSFANTMRGLELLQKGHLDPGIIAVVKPGTMGVPIYRFFLALGVKHINFLFPDVSCDSKPTLYGLYGPTPVADYLIPILDAWLEDNDPSVRIRLFHGIISQLLGGESNSDAFGNSPMGYLVIETDGGIHALDVLRVCKEDLSNSHLNVFENRLIDVVSFSPFLRTLYEEGGSLPNGCQQCGNKSICGGGYLPHRYSKKSGFNNPSAWCADIFKLINHIRQVTYPQINREFVI